jgi:hypothetical protein
LVKPIFGRDPGVIERVTSVNPADLLELTDLRSGQLSMFVRYGDRDEVNCNAQAESFIWLAGLRGIAVDVERVPGLKHAGFAESSERMYFWLGQQFAACMSPPVAAGALSNGVRVISR